jgi:hypothetical protein
MGLAESTEPLDGRAAGKRRWRSLLARMEVTAAELAGANPGAAVSLVAEAASFAVAEHSLLSLAGAASINSEPPALTRRRDAAQRRMLRALRTLVEIRQLETPIVVAQVNQVNTVGGDAMHWLQNGPPRTLAGDQVGEE